jgi:hypothetical protein
MSVSHYLTVRRETLPNGRVQHYVPLVQCKTRTGQPNQFSERFCFLPQFTGGRMPEIHRAIRFVNSNGKTDCFKLVKG